VLLLALDVDATADLEIIDARSLPAAPVSRDAHLIVTGVDNAVVARSVAAELRAMYARDHLVVSAQCIEGGGSKVLSEIKSLRDFLDSVPFVNMIKSDMKWLKSRPSGATDRGMCQEGTEYVMYMHHSTFQDGDSSRYYPDTGGFSSGIITVNLPSGNNYYYVWNDPALNKNIGHGSLKGGDDIELEIPSYSNRPDVALRITKTQAGKSLATGK
jgi:hypothetical protein